MKDNDKITLTYGQLKKLVKESSNKNNWKRVTYYQILGYIEEAFEEDWAIGINTVVEGIMDEFEIPYNSAAHDKVFDLVDRLWNENSSAMINKLYKIHKPTDKFFDNLEF